LDKQRDLIDRGEKRMIKNRVLNPIIDRPATEIARLRHFVFSILFLNADYWHLKLA
jgi:hypothetical protein